MAGSSDQQMTWLYDENSAKPKDEDFLLGKAVDVNYERGTLGQINDVEYDCTPASIFASKAEHQVDIQRKLQEDPLVALRKTEVDTRKRLLDNPLKMKEINSYIESLKKSKKEKKKKKKKKHKREFNSDDDDDEQLDKLLEAKLAKQMGRETRSTSSSPTRKPRSGSSPDQRTRKKGVFKSGLDRHSRSRSRSRSRTRKVGVIKAPPSHTEPRSRKMAVAGPPRRSRSRSRSRKNSRSEGRSSRRDRSKSRSRSRKRGRSRSGSSRRDRSKSRSRSTSRRDRSKSRSPPRKRKVGVVESPDRSKLGSRSRGKGGAGGPPRSKLLGEERERRLEEMAANADWREGQRSRNVEKYRELAEEEDRAARTQAHDPDFIRRHLSKAAESGSVEQRIQSNRYNIQRTSVDMDKNFAKR